MSELDFIIFDESCDFDEEVFNDLHAEDVAQEVYEESEREAD